MRIKFVTFNAERYADLGYNYWIRMTANETFWNFGKGGRVIVSRCMLQGRKRWGMRRRRMRIR
jgi:hypothetical protein